MKNQIKNIKDLKGKTISDSKIDCEELWLKFTDNTFVVFCVKEISEGFGYYKTCIEINEDSKDKTDYTLVVLGLITVSEYNDACEEEVKEYQKTQAIRDEEEKERIKKRELEQYEIIKSKYDL